MGYHKGKVAYSLYDCPAELASSIHKVFSGYEDLLEGKPWYAGDHGLFLWTQFQFPFWWPNILTALDSLSLIGFSPDDEDIQKRLDWLISNQGESGLWATSYGKGKKAEEVKLWVGLAACRVFKSFYYKRQGFRDQASKCRIPVRQVSSKNASSVVQ